MKICFDIREFVPGRKTGISRYLEAVLPVFLGRNDMEIVLLTGDRSAVPRHIACGRAKCVELPALPTPIVDQIVLPQIMKDEGAAIFFSPYYKIPLCGTFKRIITVHDIMFLRLPACNLAKRFANGIQFRLAAEKSDLILADSKFTRKDISSYLPNVKDKTAVVYPTLDAEWLNPVTPDDRASTRTRRSGDKPYFLYVGNFNPHKNVDLLVTAFLKLEAEGNLQNHCLILAGGEAGKIHSISSLLKQSRNPELIRIIPDIADHDLKALYSGAEWFITASEYEGFGYPALEAMARSCPVICHPSSSLPEIVQGNGIFIKQPCCADIEKAVIQAISMPNVARMAFIQKGYELARNHINTDHTKELLALINNLI